jgi:glycosyltransferase involved in cell wall biosynthesis
MLAFEFPPLSAVGAQRSLKLAKYLPERGVKPLVVTTDGPSAAAWFGRALDDQSIEELPADVVIHRVPCPRPRTPTGLGARRLRHFFSLGEDIGRRWEPHLTAVWNRLVAQSRPDAVYVSIPPFSIAPLAVRLARRSGLPLIVDFRDTWSQWCHSPHTTWLHYQLTLRRERTCLEQAWAVVGTTSQIIRDLQAAHPHVARDKFHVIHNGYDAALAVPSGPRGAGAEARPFVIGYVGSFYYSPQARASVMEPWWRLPPRHWMHYSPRREDWLYRSPFFFFRALKTMLDNRPELRSAVRVRFVGDRQEWLAQQVEHFGLQDVVEHLGRLPHRACLEFQRGCDALLATSAKVIGGYDSFIAGKTFEYVTSGRPIIAFVAEGEQRQFLQESGLALICDPDDTELSARSLEAMVAGRFFPTPNLAFLQRFHRRETSRRLADMLMGN